VGKHENTLERVISGTCNANIAFDDLCGLLTRLGFRRRVKGDHHIFSTDGVPDIINLQPGSDGKAKPYQVKQVRLMIERHKLSL
jgi:hypothetical protein